VTDGGGCVRDAGRGGRAVRCNSVNKDCESGGYGGLGWAIGCLVSHVCGAASGAVVGGGRVCIVCGVRGGARGGGRIHGIPRSYGDSVGCHFHLCLGGSFGRGTTAGGVSAARSRHVATQDLGPGGD
jgi:hypothetical protein